MDQVPEKLTTGEPLTPEELLQYLPTLKEVPATLLKQYAVGAAVRRKFRAGDIVCEEGEFGSTAFYIVSGHVDIYISNPMAHVHTIPGAGLFGGFMRRMKSMLVSASDAAHKVAEQGFIPIDASVDLPRTTPLAWLGPGELFGEMTCRTFQPRSATVRATEDCVMVEMLRVILDMLLGTRDIDATTKASTKVKAATFKGTSFKKQMDDKYRERSLVQHLKSVPLFATLDLDFFNYLKEHAELVSCSKGQVICKQGDEADAFYLIRSGLVRVAQEMPGGEMVRTYLKRGEYFGEIGLLRAQKRNATCSALDAVDLVKIGKSDFELMLQKFPVVRETLNQIATARLAADTERKLPVGLQLDEFLNQGLFEAQNLLLIDLDNCTRCDACVNACADAHEGVTRLIRDGLRYDRFLVATACRSCRDPLCMTQCPVGSIRRKESLEIIIEDWCIGCSKCAELCPYGNINMHQLEVTKEVPVSDKKPAPAAAAKPAAPAAAKPAAAAAPAKAPAAPAPAAAAKVEGEVKAEIVSAAKAPAGAAPIVDATGAPNTAPPAKPTPAEPNAAKPAPSPAPSPAPAAISPSTAVPAEAQSQASPDPAPTPATPPTPSAAAASAVPPAAPATPAQAAATPTPAPAPAAAPAAAAPTTPAAEKAPAPAAPAAKPAAAVPAAKAAAPASPAPAAPPKKMERKKVMVSKATTCDLCTQLSTPSCVYACPHDAAKRVDPTKFLAQTIGRGTIRRRFNFLSRRENRTTH